MSTELEREFSRLEDKFPPGSHFIQLDTGWREVNGEIFGGWTCKIVGSTVNVEVTEASLSEAIASALLLAAGGEASK